MHPDRPEPVLPELIQDLFAFADRIDGKANDPALLHSVRAQLPILATWVRRETHLAVAEAVGFIQSGVPDDTAWTLAQDSMGFQLVRSYFDVSGS